MKDVIEGLIKKAIESFLTEDMINQAKDFLVSELRKLALKTDNEIDDAIVAIIEKALK
jgi:hypothetical protein